jgi:hypothetical protein
MPRRFTIGRDRSCDVPIADDSVSRLHAEIWLAEDGALMMADRGSSNGTTVIRGGQSFPLRQDVLLPGDQIRMGGVLLSIQDVVAAVEARNPGVLTPKAASLPPPPPPPRVAAAPPPPPPRAAYSPSAEATVPPPPPGSTNVLVRCDCGAIKPAGQACPGCGR